MLRRFSQSLLAALILLATANLYAGKVIRKAVLGNPEIKSINVISFAPEGVLLIGDGRGGQIVALETGDTKNAGGEFKTLANIDKQLAARVGAPDKGVEIIDMAVNPASGVAYIAARKQDDKSSIVFTVSPNGKILDNPLGQALDKPPSGLDKPLRQASLDKGFRKLFFVQDSSWI